MGRDNLEQQIQDAAAEAKKDSRAVARICEYMPYAGKEAFKRLRTNILLAFSEEPEKCRVLGVTSSQISEGKSTVSINLAYSLAELGKKVLLVDTDMRRPSIHDKIGCDMTPGLSELILGVQESGKTVNVYKSSTEVTRFGFITSGAIPDNPSELLTSKRFDALLQAVISEWDYVILDLPPVNAVVDAVSVCGKTDGMIIVVRENHTPKYALKECVEQLRYAKANILGFVMNGSVDSFGKRYQYGQRYYNRYSK